MSCNQKGICQKQGLRDILTTAIMLFIDCPIRPENLRNNKWDHIQLSDSEFYLPRTKTKNGGSTIKCGRIVLDRMKNCQNMTSVLFFRSVHGCTCPKC